MTETPPSQIADEPVTSSDPTAAAQIARVRRTLRIRQGSAGGAIVLAVLTVLSALSPPLASRLEILLEVLPFPALHVAAGTVIFAGTALAVTARGLWHGHRLAWVAALVLLVVAVVLNIVKGIDVEEGLISAALAVWLATQGRAFRVLPARAQVRTALIGAGVLAAAGILVPTVLVLVFSRQHHPHAGETLRAAAERLGGRSSLPLVGFHEGATSLLTGLGVAIALAVLWLLLSPRWGTRSTGPEHLADRERARRIVAAHGGDTLSYFALRDDKEWFFAADSVVAYAVRNGVCLVSPDPIGPESERYQVWADFMEFAAGHAWAVTVVGAQATWLPVYEESGLRTTYLGDEAIVDVQGFSLAGGSMKSLRQAVGRIERDGVVARFHDPSTASAAVRERVLAIADLSRRGEVERGFSMTLSRLFDPADTGLLLVTAEDETGRVLGFIHWVPAAALPGWSLDVMRRDTAEDVPNGVIDFLIVKTVEHLAAAGDSGLGLNFAVLRETMTTDPTTQAGRLARRVLDVVAEHSQLESLGKFNEKFRPAWVPRYVARGTGTQLVGQALAVAQAEGLIELPTPARSRTA